eukprot:GHVS01002394.1.p1 GENE.GHVS01002394.1~~GHVS01002394.1.p1  ORF type:complete len:144 (-),score=7.01 GHVS01002394.1:42-473(-)
MLVTRFHHVRYYQLHSPLCRQLGSKSRISTWTGGRCTPTDAPTSPTGALTCKGGASPGRPDVRSPPLTGVSVLVKLCVRFVDLIAATNSCIVIGGDIPGAAGDDGSELDDPLPMYTPSPDMVSNCTNALCTSKVDYSANSSIS